MGGCFGQGDRGYRGDTLVMPSQDTGVPRQDPMGKGSVRNELTAALGAGRVPPREALIVGC